MAYEKRTNRRRRHSRRPIRKGRLQNARKMTGDSPITPVDRIARGVGTVATIAKTVSGIVSMINVEDKFLDTPFTGTATTVTQFAQVLNAVKQGIDYNQRNGNKLLDKYLQINIILSLDASTAPNTTLIMRCVILIDKKPQIGALTWNTVYEPNNDVSALIDKNTAGDRVVVLKDYKIILNGTNVRQKYIKFYCPLARLHTQFTGPNATDFESGAIYFLMISSASGLTPAPIVQATSRFAYMDN